MEKMEIGVNFTCIVPSGEWAQVLWLFWGCSLPGARVVTYFVPVDLCVLGPALLGRHHSLEGARGFLVVSKEDPKLVHCKDNPRIPGILFWSWCAWSGW